MEQVGIGRFTACGSASTCPKFVHHHSPGRTGGVAVQQGHAACSPALDLCTLYFKTLVTLGGVGNTTLEDHAHCQLHLTQQPFP